MKWEEGFQISARIDGDTILISANQAGLLSLANHFMNLAAAEPGSHIHLDAYNSLEEDSAELIVERME